MISQGGGGMMTRKNSQTTFAIVGAFILVTILSYYSWSLTSENRTLKRLVVNTYSKLKDMTSHKSMMEKKNTLLSNRMVEMEEQRNAEKQNAEMEQREKQKCTLKLDELTSDCKSHSDEIKKCEDASLRRENKLLSLLKDIHLGTVDSEAEKDIFVAKIKHLKDKLKTVETDFRSLQDKYTEVDKKKIDLDEKNVVLNTKLKACTEQKVVHVSREPVDASETAKEKKEEMDLETDTSDEARKVYPEKDKQVLNKQVKDAITKSNLKTEESGTSAPLESKLVTNVVSPVPASASTVNAKDSAPKVGIEEAHDKKPGDADKRTGGKESPKKSSQPLTKPLSKSKTLTSPPVKQSKKSKNKKVGAEKVKEKVKRKGNLSTATPNTETVTAGHVKKSRDDEAVKRSQVNDDDFDGKAEDLGARTLEDGSKGEYRKNGKFKDDLDNDDLADNVVMDGKKPVDESVIKEGDYKNKDQKKQGDSNDTRQKGMNSSEKKSEDDSLLSREPNSDDDVENLAISHEKLNGEPHKEPTASNGLREDSTDEPDNGPLITVPKDSMGLTE